MGSASAPEPLDAAPRVVHPTSDPASVSHGPAGRGWELGSLATQGWVQDAPPLGRQTRTAGNKNPYQSA